MSARGHSVMVARGYQIHAWAGPGVDAGTTKPYSVSPLGSFTRQWFASQGEAEAWLASAPALVVVRVSLEAYVPTRASDEQIAEWVRFRLHAHGSLSEDNPLVHHEFEAHEVSIDDVSEVI